MADTVKFVFKTLIKVPVIIVVAFGLFNVFMFGLSYFKMMGLGDAAMMTAVQNNYIPSQEKATLEQYMNDELETGVLRDVKFTSNTTFSKKQYGETVTVGVKGDFKWINPLTPRDQAKSDFVGNNARGFGGWLSDSELQAKRNEDERRGNSIVFEYKVPGLTYYPDME